MLFRDIVTVAGSGENRQAIALFLNFVENLSEIFFRNISFTSAKLGAKYSNFEKKQ